MWEGELSVGSSKIVGFGGGEESRDSSRNNRALVGELFSLPLFFSSAPQSLSRIGGGTFY